jgi:hypothetical protein
MRDLSVLTLEVNGIDEVVDPNDDLFVDDSNLNKEFGEQPSKFAFYGGLHSDAVVTLETLKNNLKKYEADNEIVMRHRIAERYGATERLTEAKMEAEFARDDKWQAMKTELLEWQKVVGRLEVLKEAFKQRAQMLWNIGATRRQEMVRLNPNIED